MKLSKSLFIAAVLALLLVITVQAAPLAGAIFTTTPDGAIVNENVRYEDKRDVYLDGGPGPNAPASAAGLPDGYYVFQITDPSGKFLLSQDPTRCRVVRAQGGVIVELVPPVQIPGLGATTNKWADSGPYASQACHIADAPTPPNGPGVRGPSGRHDTNIDADHWSDANAIVVQMMPYGTTPNPGGVYKAWITPLGTYDAKVTNRSLVQQLNAVPSQLPNGQQRPHACPDFCASADNGFAPPRDQVKTDNFKVKEFFPPEITVRKFHDLDGDSIWDLGEPEIGVDQCVDSNGNIIACPGGWPYDFTEPTDGSPTTGTFYTPQTHLAGVAGTYTACEFHLPGWTQSAAYVDGVQYNANQCVSVTVSGAAPGEKHEIVFGNFMNATKSGVKFEDLDGDGAAREAGEPGLPNWTITLNGTDGMGNAVSMSTTTGANGSYSFSVPPGSYTVCEVLKLNWFQSYPSPGGCYNITLTSGQVDSDNDFGNFRNATKSGMKFEDLNGNGQKNAGEPGLSGWTINLTGTDGMGNAVNNSTVTGVNGNYSFTVPPGTYTVCEVLKDGWTQTYPGGDGCYDITLTSGQIDNDNDFGNFRNVDVTACKLKDADGSLATTGDQTPIAGWTVKLTKNGVVQDTQLTGWNGCYTWTNLGPVPGGYYDVSEDVPPGWIPLTPTSYNFESPPQSGASYSFTFINTPTQGCTPGFWQGGNDFGNAGGRWLWNTYPDDPEWALSGGMGSNPYEWATLFNSFFTPYSGLDGFDMMSLVGTGGGEDDFQKAGRDLVAAYLNSSWGMAYAYSPSELQAMWDDAVQSGDFMSLHLLLDAANNAPGGCPISASGY